MPGRMAPSLDAHETSHDWRRPGGDSIFPVKVRMATWVAANTATTTTGVGVLAVLHYFLSNCSLK